MLQCIPAISHPTCCIASLRAPRPCLSFLTAPIITHLPMLPLPCFPAHVLNQRWHWHTHQIHIQPTPNSLPARHSPPCPASSCPTIPKPQAGTLKMMLHEAFFLLSEDGESSPSPFRPLRLHIRRSLRSVPQRSRIALICRSVCRDVDSAPMCRQCTGPILTTSSLSSHSVSLHRHPAPGASMNCAPAPVFAAD